MKFKYADNVAGVSDVECASGILDKLESANKVYKNKLERGKNLTAIATEKNISMVVTRTTIL